MCLLPSSPVLFFFYGYGHHRDLHSFPTRRSSDLDAPARLARLVPPRVEHVDYRPDVAPPSPSPAPRAPRDRKSTRLNSSHTVISYAVFCLKKKKKQQKQYQRNNRNTDIIITIRIH